MAVHWSRFRQFLLGTSYSRGRLETSISLLQAELDCSAESQSAYIQRARTFLEKAKDSLQRNRISEGWALVQATERELIKRLESDPERLLLKAEQVRSEADEKLSNWRKKAVRAAISDERIVKKEVNGNSVAEAQRILDEDAGNVYQRIEITRDQLLILLGALLIDLALIVYFFEEAISPLLFSAGGLLDSQWKIIGVLLLGALGGALTAIFTIARAGLRGRIPALIGSRLFTFFRPLIGAGSALVVVLFVHSLGRAGLDLHKIPDEAIPIIAVAAGYSEKLLLGAIASVTSRGS